MFAAWAAIEPVRYLYYLLKLFHIEVFPLTWLRYSLFLILYPLGITGELLVIVNSLPAIESGKIWSQQLPNTWNVVYNHSWALKASFLLYAYAAPTLFSYMLRQRSKELGGAAAAEGQAEGSKGEAATGAGADKAAVAPGTMEAERERKQR